MYKTKFDIKISEKLKSTYITIFGYLRNTLIRSVGFQPFILGIKIVFNFFFFNNHVLCHEEQNLVYYLWADLEGSIDGLIEGMGELLGEVLGVEEDEAAVELMNQEVIANVDAILQVSHIAMANSVMCTV